MTVSVTVTMSVPDVGACLTVGARAGSELGAMLEKARVYERLQRRPPPAGWEPTLKEQHHIGLLQDCVQLAPIPAVSERWLANMVQVGPTQTYHKLQTFAIAKKQLQCAGLYL